MYKKYGKINQSSQLSKFNLQDNSRISDSLIKKELYYTIIDENEKLDEEEERKKREKCRQIHVELYHNNITKIITVKENILIKLFKLQCLKAFNLIEIHPYNVRLKAKYKENVIKNSGKNEYTYFLSDNIVNL